MDRQRAKANELEMKFQALHDNGRCVDPDKCDDPECFANFDIPRLLEDNNQLEQEVEYVNEENNKLVAVLHEWDDEIAQLKNNHRWNWGQIHDMKVWE